MDIKQALELLDKASSMFAGTRQDHVNIQNAVKIINDFIKKDSENEKQEQK